MKFKMLAPALSLTALAALGANHAQAQELAVTGNVAFASEYVFRGQSQTQEEPAIQGGLDLSYGGFYLGAWGSNVDFQTSANAEIDLYGGYKFGLAEDLTLDLGYIYYSYANEADLNYNEIKAAVTWKSLTAGVNYSWDYLGDDPFGEGDVDFFYYFADYAIALPSDFRLGLHAALNQATDDDNNIAFEATPESEYLEWSVSIAKALGGVDFKLTYWGTDIDDDDNEFGDDRLVFSISRAF